MGGMTHDAFAKKVGLVQRNYLSNYKSGKSTPGDDTIERIIKTIGMKPTDAQRLRSAAITDRNARREDNATEDLLLKQEIEGTRTQQEDIEINTITGGQDQVIPIEKGSCMLCNDEDEKLFMETAMWGLKLKRLGVSQETILKVMIEIENVKKGNALQENEQPVAASK